MAFRFFLVLPLLIMDGGQCLVPDWRVLTLDVFWVVNNEVSVPHDREIHRQLADFHPLVEILERRRRGGGGFREPIQTRP